MRKTIFLLTLPSIGDFQSKVNGNYYLLGMTGLTEPLVHWTPAVSNNFDVGGDFSYNHPMDPNAPKNLYRLQIA